MGINIKQRIQEHIHKKNLKKYEESVSLQKDSYSAYIAAESKLRGHHTIEKVPEEPTVYEEVLLIPYTKCTGKDCLQGSLAPYILFAAPQGWLETETFAVVKEFFEEKNCDVLYTNEDCMEENGSRHTPWFKPEWSPDTFLSYFYFGGMVAVRRSALEQVLWPLEESGLACVYALLLQLCNRKKPLLCEQILFHAKQNTSMPGCGENYIALKQQYLLSLGKNVRMSKEKDGIVYPFYEVVDATISILIPSKDHPRVLERCVKSLRDKTSYKKLEIIVIDNGSAAEQKQCYEQLAKQYHFRYLYVPMDFNFSKMCNKAAKEAKGELFLFLNDDVEILIPDWLERMAGMASLEHIGSVGAKLLFPQTDLIQHVGITNMYQGPAHKLLKMSDAECYDHGRNRGVRDVIGVTAACLMVQKDKYKQIGGFTEELAVAYNDVDFCFQLHQAGYYNVIRNDVVLYHHESLSRGDDRADESKRLRLKKEGEILYTRNPGYYDYDPFYSHGLTGVSEKYECCLPYENRNLKPCRRIEKIDVVLQKSMINETLIIHVDTAQREQFVPRGDRKCYLIDLHAHVRGLDSSNYKYRMILKNEHNCYDVMAVRRYRPDAIRTHHDQVHIELSGFAVRIPEGMLQKGTYEIWMEAKCIFSRQVLQNRAQERLLVE